MLPSARVCYYYVNAFVSAAAAAGGKIEYCRVCETILEGCVYSGGGAKLMLKHMLED